MMNNSDVKILLVDDELDILEFLGYNLKKEGYQVFTANNGREALRRVDEVKPHIVLLDVMMPEMDGIETCIELRKKASMSQAYISFLTARSEDYSQVAGLEAGADDYISKPIKPKVLISRINAFVRRISKVSDVESGSEGLTVLNHIIIDKERYIVIVDGKEIVLPKKEFEILAVIASKPNKVFRREEIFARVWGNDVIVGDRTIDVHVRKIREKTNLENIKTVKGVGYKYEEL